MIEIGDKIGSWEILKPIGSGGHGSVYAAYCSKRKHELAIKLLHQNLVGQKIRERGPTIAERFLAEARILQSLNHPGICKIYEVFDDREKQLVAYSMELLQGSDLTIASSYLKLPELLNIFAKTADTLQYLHNNNVIHRDVKPANIFISRPRNNEEGTKQIKLLDFGVAKELHQEAILSETATGVFVGSVQTMAPESFNRWERKQGKQIEPPLDQWAMGVSLYQCLSGKLPFTGANVVDLIIALEQQEPTPLELRPDYSSFDVEELLQSLIFRTLQKSPADRFSTMNDLAGALREITESLGNGVGTVVTSTDFLESTILSQKPATTDKENIPSLESPPPLASSLDSELELSRTAVPQNQAVYSSPPQPIQTASNREGTKSAPERKSLMTSIVRMAALEFYFWLLTIFVLGFVAGFVVRLL